MLVGFYKQTYYGRPSGHPSVCLQSENGIKPEFVFDGQLCLRKAEFFSPGIEKGRITVWESRNRR